MSGRLEGWKNHTSNLPTFQTETQFSPETEVPFFLLFIAFFQTFTELGGDVFAVLRYVSSRVYNLGCAFLEDVLYLVLQDSCSRIGDGLVTPIRVKDVSKEFNPCIETCDLRLFWIQF